MSSGILFILNKKKKKISEINLALQIPKSTNDEFESFLKNFELTLDKIHEENPFIISVLGDFSAKSTFYECSMIDAVTSNLDYIN